MSEVLVNDYRHLFSSWIMRVHWFFRNRLPKATPTDRTKLAVEIGKLVKDHGNDVDIPSNLSARNDEDILKIFTATQTVLLRSFFSYVHLINLVFNQATIALQPRLFFLFHAIFSLILLFWSLKIIELPLIPCEASFLVTSMLIGYFDRTNLIFVFFEIKTYLVLPALSSPNLQRNVWRIFGSVVWTVWEMARKKGY